MCKTLLDCLLQIDFPPVLWSVSRSETPLGLERLCFGAVAAVSRCTPILTTLTDNENEPQDSLQHQANTCSRTAPPGKLPSDRFTGDRGQPSRSCGDRRVRSAVLPAGRLVQLIISAFGHMYQPQRIPGNDPEAHHDCLLQRKIAAHTSAIVAPRGQNEAQLGLLRRRGLATSVSRSKSALAHAKPSQSNPQET